MPDKYTDPSANTQQFRAFVQQTEAEPETTRPLGLIVAGVAAVAVLLALAIWLLTS
ncbi:MAG TPA: hypothetical protein VES42_13020 [Pilimelia sp.]|nr:hypothetical protein [Pilimelia sp.]